jgi:iron-sulfur cluster repair protein YtfE (RIC family)
MELYTMPDPTSDELEAMAKDETLDTLSQVIDEMRAQMRLHIRREEAIDFAKGLAAMIALGALFILACAL